MANYKLVDADALDSNLTTIADAIRERTGETRSLSSPADFVDAISDLSQDLLTARVTGTLSEYSNSEITNIGNYAFAGCSSLTSVRFPNCINIGSNAFRSCTGLTSVSFPNCTNIGYYAFYYCYSLTSVSFPACISIEYMGFAYCKNLTFVSFPVCTIIDKYAFGSCYMLTSINLPACTSIEWDAFISCYRLTSVNLPACVKISGYAFRDCYSLSKLYLGASSVCTLLDSTAFNLTPYAGYSAYFSGTPHIYVPSSLVVTYQSATNWAYFSSYFVGI